MAISSLDGVDDSAGAEGACVETLDALDAPPRGMSSRWMIGDAGRSIAGRCSSAALTLCSAREPALPSLLDLATRNCSSAGSPVPVWPSRLVTGPVVLRVLVSAADVGDADEGAGDDGTAARCTLSGGRFVGGAATGEAMRCASPAGKGEPKLACTSGELENIEEADTSAVRDDAVSSAGACADVRGSLERCTDGDSRRLTGLIGVNDPATADLLDGADGCDDGCDADTGRR